MLKELLLEGLNGFTDFIVCYLEPKNSHEPRAEKLQVVSERHKDVHGEIEMDKAQKLKDLFYKGLNGLTDFLGRYLGPKI